jgi:hypothetical protein
MSKDYKNRFNYEQELLKAWGVTDDIKELNEMFKQGTLTSEALQGCAQLYDHRFEELWKYFEASITKVDVKDIELQQLIKQRDETYGQ